MCYCAAGFVVVTRHFSRLLRCKYSDSELDDALTNDAQAELDSSGEESNVDSPSKNNNSDVQNLVQVNQDLIGKDGTAWQALAISHVRRGRLQQQNILSFKPGPTAFATSRITESRLVIARGILGQRGLPVESLWDITWGCSILNKTLSRCRFKEIIYFLHFDVKSERRQRVTSFAWLPRCGNLLLKTLRRRICLVLTLQLTNNYFHVRLKAGLFNTCRINLTSLESSSGWQFMPRQNTFTIAFCISAVGLLQ